MHRENGNGLVGELIGDENCQILNYHLHLILNSKNHALQCQSGQMCYETQKTNKLARERADLLLLLAEVKKTMAKCVTEYIQYLLMTSVHFTFLPPSQNNEMILKHQNLKNPKSSNAA